jgi:hypothetical protein
VHDVVIGVQDLRGRWVMTTFDPDTLVQAPKVPGHITPARTQRIRPVLRTSLGEPRCSAPLRRG